ncbi:MAG: hypothetical protein ACREM8_02835 [Vulcanimicrobiaceae bacterium]
MRSLPRTLIFASAMVIAAGAPALADDATPLPFVPPAAWQPIPAALIPPTPLSWAHDGSSLSVSQTPVPLDSPKLSGIMKAAFATSGTVEQSSHPPACGKQAVRFVVRPAAGNLLMTQQIQSAGDVTYLISYLRPANVADDPVIERTISQLCSAQALANAAPPPGWSVNHIRILGVWIGPSPLQTIVAVAGDPQANVAGLETQALRTTVHTPNVEVRSQRTGTLCGLPAYFATAQTAKGPEPTIVQVAATQSQAAAYVLIYTHPVRQAADPKASASLQTLCAAPSAGAPSAAPQGSSSPAPSPQPSSR